MTRSTGSVIARSLCRHLDGKAISGNYSEKRKKKKRGWPAITGSDSQFTTAFVIKKDGNKLHQF